MATQKKFEFRNGVLVRIPDAASSSASAATAVGGASTAGKPGAVPTTVIPIAMVCSADELATASEVTQAQGVATTVPVATQAAIEGFYNPDFVNQYHATAATSGEGILEHLGSIFASLEIPLGVLSKLLVLNKYRLNFIIDDSGSMRSQTDSDKYQAGPFVLNRFKKSGVELYSPMTRWEEVEDRLHTMMEVLAYVPTGIITICFLNRPNVVHLDRTGKEPATFLQQSHLDIEKLFVAQPDGGTPIYASLDRAFRSSAGPTMHYLFTDGEPSDADTHRVTKLVLERPNPIQNPVTFVSCTGDDQATEWMKELDDAGPMLAEVDDYEDEKREVLSKQGPVLPYTRGLWLMSLIVGAINPDDLDGLDDSEPISKYTLDNLMGRILTAQEYSQYFSNHPKASSYRLKYSQFANEKKSTREILGLPAPGTKPPPKKSFFGLF